MKGIATTCACGMRIEPGGSCSRCASSAYQASRCVKCGASIGAGVLCDICLGRRDERSRGSQRRHYASPEYRRNRLERYRLVGGRCETPGCGIALAGELHSAADGAVPWESDHVIELIDGGTDDVANLRVRCVPHHRAKTAAARKARRRTR